MNSLSSIGKFEFFTIFFLFTFVHAMSRCLCSVALQDAWIATIVSGSAGIILVFLYSKIYEKHQGKDIYQGLYFFLGSFFGNILVVLYGLFFLFNSVFSLSSTENLLKTSILPETSGWQITLPFVLLTMYIVFLGIQAISRTSLLFFYVCMLGFIILFVFLAFSKAYDFSFVTPVLEYGMKPVFKAAFGPAIIKFANLVSMLLIFPYVVSPKKVTGTAIKTTLFIVFFLTLVIFTMLVTLHPILFATSNYPFLETSFRISLIENFIHRIDPIIVVLVLTFSLINLVINFWGAYKSVSYLFTKIPNGLSIILVGLILFIITLIITKQLVRANDVMHQIFYYLSVCFGIVIPFLLYFIYSLLEKKMYKKKQPE